MSIKKPQLEDALDFAEEAPKKESKSGKVPEGDVRLTSNISADRHRRLKYKSADLRRPIGVILEQMIDKYLDRIK
ncbi:MAG: hypothetical protein GY753_09965 [Gammaproteobacteria bacterium]|nr:hypothetical protein [Gammaproteobacteria bacterium]